MSFDLSWMGKGPSDKEVKCEKTFVNLLKWMFIYIPALIFWTVAILNLIKKFI